MSTVAVTPKIVLAHLKRRTALCQRCALVLTTLNQQGSSDGSPAFLAQFRDAASALEVAAHMEYEFETLMMLAKGASPKERKAYTEVLTVATASVFKVLVDGETFTHLGIPGKG